MSINLISLKPSLISSPEALPQAHQRGTHHTPLDPSKQSRPAWTISIQIQSGMEHLMQPVLSRWW